MSAYGDVRPAVRWAYHLDRVAFDRTFSLGGATFRPAGEVAAEVQARRSTVDVTIAGHLHRWEVAAEVADRFDCATVEVLAPTSAEARHLLGEAMGAFRFLMREIVQVNQDIHRIGVVGEVDHRVLDYVVLADNGVAAAGWSLEDSPMRFTFNRSRLDSWTTDGRVVWLDRELRRTTEDRTEAGRRAVTALGLLDSAFLTRDPLVRIMFSAVAVESMFASRTEPRHQTASVQIARRVAYLTCPSHGADDDSPVCPYIGGLDRHGDVVSLAAEWAEADRQWQCSPFLDISTPEDLEPYRRSLSLFSARNEVAHEGRTSADAKAVSRLRGVAEHAVSAGIAWFASHPGMTIKDLDTEIDVKVKNRRVLSPADIPER